MADPKHNGGGTPLLEVEDLEVCFDTEVGTLTAVDGVSLTIPRGRVMGLVGESGCGKSVTAYSILRLVQPPGRIRNGRIRLNPEAGDPVDIAGLRETDELLYRLRGGMVSMIFQEPMTALSPVHTVGNQLCEAILLHQSIGAGEAERLAVGMLERVGIPGAADRLRQYPFEMSGGMRQRVVIAMALVCRPELLIADEPTTALDVTIQAQIMDLMRALQAEMNTAILLITHDLGVVAQMCHDVAVMYLGRIVERGTVRQILKTPQHPYTRGLLASLPGLSLDRPELPSIEGTVPSLFEIPPGCPFHPRCPFSLEGTCDTGAPPALRPPLAGHEVACLRAGELETAP